MDAALSFGVSMISEVPSKYVSNPHDFIVRIRRASNINFSLIRTHISKIRHGKEGKEGIIV